MEFEGLCTHVGNELKRRFWEHKAMAALSRGRVRMDGWLKVELTAILAQIGEESVREALASLDWMRGQEKKLIVSA